MAVIAAAVVVIVVVIAVERGYAFRAGMFSVMLSRHMYALPAALIKSNQRLWDGYGLGLHILWSATRDSASADWGSAGYF